MLRRAVSASHCCDRLGASCRASLATLATAAASGSRRREALRRCANGAGKPPLTDDRTANSAAAAAATTGDAAGAAAAPEQPRRTRRIKLHEPAGVDAKTKAFYAGSGSFLAGFSSIALISLGCAFLFVPLYRLYCSPQGRGADPKYVANRAKRERDEEDATNPNPLRRKLLNVRFLSDVGNTMPIVFVPLQRSLDVLIGEPALAFYSAYNKTNRTLLGVSTYTISPAEGMAYLNKIQCFCFEEQRFKPHELVEMPVFFYIDRDFLNDPMVSWLDEVILNYTFFNMSKTRDILGEAVTGR
jgi:cytochrome c oxidase assembly protein subunit 11